MVFKVFRVDAKSIRSYSLEETGIAMGKKMGLKKLFSLPEMNLKNEQINFEIVHEIYRKRYLMEDSRTRTRLGPPW